MTELIALIDYGSGNLRSASKAFERVITEQSLDAEVRVTADPEQVARADRVVLPGVGAYADCKAGLVAVDGMLQALQQAVHVKAVPFLGICVGMQLMATRGLEHGETPGLNWVSGQVIQIRPRDPALKIPHMGWNVLHPTQAHPILNGIATGDEGLHAYFVHSYHFVPDDKADLVATTDYAGSATAIICRDNMVGTQFHPEKSQTLGLSLIANFLSWKP